MLSLLLTFALQSPAASVDAPVAAEPLDVLTWNIWHGGREDGEDVGPARVADVLRDSGAELIALQETYGSGELLADALGFHFHPRGTNVSILSRYPVLEDLSVGPEFNCAGALVELPDGGRAAFFSIWLPYSGEIWAAGTRDTSDPAAMLAACQASDDLMSTLWPAIQERHAALKNAADVPLILAGDFNTMSHLDYSEVGRDQYGVPVAWPVAQGLARAGLRDAYRECNPRIDRTADATWTPRFPDQEQDRIDFIQYRATDLRATESQVLRSHADGFPSDHAAVLARFEPRDVPARSQLALRAVSYNILHGAGMDGALDLERTAGVLRELQPDFVALQEVDLRVERSGSVNQAAELGAALDMHAAHAAFMPLQSGHYGMGLLSRYPIVRTEAVELPPGGEPRVALIVEVRLPDDRVISLVNVHFDWVDDDSVRFAQAAVLAAHLRTLAHPFILIGDFNDVPDSRTIDLMRSVATESSKQGDNRATWPAHAPTVEIDFVFSAPQSAWTRKSARVVDERLASDHRPVVADLILQ